MIVRACIHTAHVLLLQDLPGGGIKNETTVEVEDFSQDLTVKLNISHKTFDEEEVSPVDCLWSVVDP